MHSPTPEIPISVSHQNLLDNLPVPVFVMDQNRRYRYANAAYLQWTGIAADTYTEKLQQDVMDPATCHTVENYIQSALSGQAVSFKLWQNQIGTLTVHYTP